MQAVPEADVVRLALAQTRVFPGQTARNVDTIVREIRAAEARGMDLVVFPEMAVPGYLIGDLWEDDDFVRDVVAANHEIAAATAGGIAAIWGSLAVDPEGVAEDGRRRKLNAGFVAQGGAVVGLVPKTLLPRYRFFDDARHYVSTRQLVEEAREQERATGNRPATHLGDLLRPLPISFRGRAPVPVGVMLCEDMWHADYPFDPACVLVEQGARLLVNLSASPWTWQKTRKRHAVIADLLSSARVPFVYVNAVGVQNNGKNFITFDGSSAVYRADGSPALSLPAHEAHTADTVLPPPPEGGAPASVADDSRELFEAIAAALRAFLESLPPEHRRAVVGVSGGIDSATVLALFTHVLGPERVLAVSMPTRFNGPTTRALTAQLAANLGVELTTIDIQELVDHTAAAAGITPSDFAYENVQARLRGQLLAALAQKRGGFFTCNGNKVEMAFGYCTLYGDLAGAIAPLADLVKREVRQLADHLNREVFRREVIPRACIELKPSAELSHTQSVEEGKGDPFDYGTLADRGYHDEMVRAFTEFRRGPEWFLDEYVDGTLERTLQLPPGRLARLFPTSAAFVEDLERRWRGFFGAVFKRVQAPPAPVVSRRAFGYDLRESVLPAPFGRRYRERREAALARPVRKPRVAVYGGSFNPPCRHHRAIAERLAARFDRLMVVPCGIRSDKASTALVDSEHRRRMVERAFGGLPGVTLDFTDIDERRFTPAVEIDERLRARWPEVEVWHAAGGDIVAGGARRQSEIQRTWKRGREIWLTLPWVVLTREGSGMIPADLPPQAEVVDVSDLVGSSTVVRERLAGGADVSRLLDPEVEAYIRAHGLYGAG